MTITTLKTAGVERLVFLMFAFLVFVQTMIADSGKQESSYILTSGDLISVQVFGQADLHSEQEITGEGTINLGLIGAIEVVPMTVAAAEKKIRQTYIDQRFLKNPQIIIKVRRYSPKLVSVLGQVNQPGSIQLPNDSNAVPLARVISMVGDFSAIARKDAIRVVRKNAKGEEETILVDMSDIGSEKDGNRADIDFLIYPNDVIFVPEKWW